MKIENLFRNYFQKQIYVWKKKQTIFFNYFLRIVYKIIIQMCRMIKNKVIDIKIIFKTYFKILKIS